MFTSEIQEHFAPSLGLSSVPIYLCFAELFLGPLWVVQRSHGCGGGGRGGERRREKVLCKICDKFFITLRLGGIVVLVMVLLF